MEIDALDRCLGAAQGTELDSEEAETDPLCTGLGEVKKILVQSAGSNGYHRSV